MVMVLRQIFQFGVIDVESSDVMAALMVVGDQIGNGAIEKGARVFDRSRVFNAGEIRKRLLNEVFRLRRSIAHEPARKSGQFRAITLKKRTDGNRSRFA